MKRVSPMSTQAGSPLDQNMEPMIFDVFIGRLPAYVTRSIMRNMAKNYNFVKAKILGKNIDKASSVAFKSGFISFRDIQSAQRFVDDHNDKDVFGSSVPLNVRFADGKGKQKVFIGNIEAGTTQEEFNRFVSKYGRVLTCKMVVAENLSAVVVFSSDREADACVRAISEMETGIFAQYAKSAAANKAQKEADDAEWHAKRQKVCPVSPFDQFATFAAAPMQMAPGWDFQQPMQYAPDMYITAPVVDSSLSSSPGTFVDEYGNVFTAAHDPMTHMQPQNTFFQPINYMDNTQQSFLPPQQQLPPVNELNRQPPAFP